MKNFFVLDNSNKFIWSLLLWQLVSVGLMAVGVWPQEVAWLNFALVTVGMIFLKPIDALVLFVVSVPFFVVLPNQFGDSLSMWRPLVIILFSVVLLKEVVKQKINFFSLSSLNKFIISNIKKLAAWDVLGFLFVALSLASLIFAKYSFEGLKQIIFLVNAYILYSVILIVVTKRSELIRLLKFSTISLSIIVVFGYLQLFITLFTPQYYFWQYWAIMVSKVYYGLGLSNVLGYSNSWFSYTGSIPSLRMFSIMPDSHSFGMMAVMLIGLLFTLTFLYKQEKSSWRKPKELFKNPQNYLWSAIRFSGLAVIFSGTRGLWVGMLPAFGLNIILFFYKNSKQLAKKAMLTFIFVLLFFVLSPVINYGLNVVRINSLSEDFIDRAASIYDLSEESNAGRLIIWKDSLNFALSHPLGVGYGNFLVSLVDNIPENTSFEELAEIKNLRYNLPQKFVTAHSLYLNILVELGILGLVVFLAFFGVYYKKVWEFFKANSFEPNMLSAFVFMFALIYIWFLAYGIFDVTLFNDKVLIYGFVSLAISGFIMKNYEKLKQEGDQ